MRRLRERYAEAPAGPGPGDEVPLSARNPAAATPTSTRVFDRFREGVTISLLSRRNGHLSERGQAKIERAVLDLVS